MTLIFIGSYANIPSAIDIILKSKRGFRIISSDEKVIKLFSEMCSAENAVLLPCLFSSFRKPFQMCCDIIKLQTCKAKYLLLLRKLHPEKIVFFFVGGVGLMSYLIKKLSSETVFEN